MCGGFLSEFLAGQGLITWAGRGVGRALTEAGLAAAERVIATVRDPDVLAQLTIRHSDRLQIELAAASRCVGRLIVVPGSSSTVEWRVTPGAG